MNNSTQSEMTPIGYLKVFFRRKELLIISLFLGLVSGICLGIILPREYVSSTVILVEEGKTDNPLFDQLAVSSTIQQRMLAIKESMLGWTSLVELVKRLHLDKDINTKKDFENLILGIRDDVKIRMSGQNIIHLSYLGKNPEETKAVVENITDIFISKNVDIQNKETSDAIIFIEEQLKVYRGKIKSAEIAQMKDSLKALLRDSTEQHPKVIELRDNIYAKEDELRKENLEYNENVILDSKTTNPIISEIKKALDNIEGEASPEVTTEEMKNEYYKVMLIEKLDKVMARDVGVNNSIYNMLLQRLETAKITQRLQSSKEGTRYTILDPPRVPLDPVKPNKILFALGGLIFGGIVGFGLVVGIEFLDKSFIDVEEAKKFLGTPLLGAISRINTIESIRHDKEKVGWLYSLTVIAGIVAIVLTTAISNFLY